MTLSLLSTLAVAGVLRDALAEFEAASGTGVTPDLAPTQALLARIRGGARGDVAILTSDGITLLQGEGVLAAGSAVPLVRSFVGVAVRAGAPKPDLSTADSFQQALLDARSISYSRHGASGIFFAGLIERLGIAEAVNRKAIVMDQGYTAEPVARGEAELAIQQVSELMAVPGVDIAGRLPEPVASVTAFSAAVFAGCAQADAAAALCRFLAAPSMAARYTAAGLEAI